MAKTMKCARFTTKGGKLELADVPIPEPKKGQVRIEVYACGVCHSDVMAQQGFFGAFPRIPGHEVAGVIDVVGEGVTTLKKGDKVGVGWYGGNHCGSCKACKKDVFVSCEKVVPCGGGYDGGYAEYMVAPADAVAIIPDGLDFKFAGPLCCAGITTFNSLRNSGAVAGDLCVVSGIGGLGHLAIQFANKMGLRVVAVSTGKDKEELAKKLGAHHYIDTSAEKAVDKIKQLGGADVIVCTAPHSKAIEELIPALGLNGKMLIVAVPHEPVTFSVFSILPNRASIQGWASGDNRDTEQTLQFAALTNVQPMIEVFPLEKAQEAFDKMLDNKVRFRSVIVIKK